MKIKKMLVGAFLGIFALAGVAVLPNYASAQEIDDQSANDEGCDWSNPDNTNCIDGKKLEGSKLLDTVKKAINWVLGILATIALVMCLYAGFLMVTSGGDDKKYKKGLEILKYAAIGLAIVGLSWAFVSLISWFVNTMHGE